MPPFTDIHCHLLPGVDDGPKTLPESLQLARSLVKNGFYHAIATPHYLDNYSPDYRSRVEESYSQLTQALESENVPLTVYLGGELMINPILKKLAKTGELPTLNGTRYVMLELPLYQPLPLYMEDVLFTLQTLGYLPILAHPERMQAFKGDIQKIFILANRGIYMQINLGSLMGIYGGSAKKLAHDLLTYRLASFVASDSHHAPLLDKVAGDLKNISFSSDLLQKNPEKVLQDESIALNPEKPSRHFGGKVWKKLRL